MKNSLQHKGKAINVEALLAKKNQISNVAIQAALVKMEEQKAKAQEEMVIQHLADIQNTTENAVEQLRRIRVRERAIKAYLVSVAEAEQVFYTNADYAIYQQSVQTANKELHKVI